MRPEHPFAATVREEPEVTVGVELTLTTNRWVTIGDLRTFLEKAEAYGLDDSAEIRVGRATSDLEAVDILKASR